MRVRAEGFGVVGAAYPAMDAEELVFFMAFGRPVGGKIPHEEISESCDALTKGMIRNFRQGGVPACPVEKRLLGAFINQEGLDTG